jgi:hypothetical protein
MKLIAKGRVYGVEVLKRKPGNSSRSETMALPGDIYEGPQAHIDKLKCATAYAAPMQLETDDSNDAGADEKAARIAELKKRATELGATDNQVKTNSEKKLLDLIEKLGDGTGDDGTLGL